MKLNFHRLDKPWSFCDKLIVVLILWIPIALIVFASPAPAQQSNTSNTARSFYDGNGHFAGSSTTHGNSTSFSDRNGHFDGNAIRNSDGTTSFYDRNGHFTGSAKSR